MAQHNSINYLEIPVNNVLATKAFFKQVFGWDFQDYGPDYTCFLNVGIDGGFYQSPLSFTLANGCPLIVLYSQDLEVTQAAVIDAGGLISRDTFLFPGGRRFHFTDINGNEYAVWSQ